MVFDSPAFRLPSIIALSVRGDRPTAGRGPLTSTIAVRIRVPVPTLSRRLPPQPDEEHLEASAARALGPDHLHLREQRSQRVARLGEVVAHEELAHERAPRS